MKFEKNSYSWQALRYARRVCTGQIDACWQVRSAAQRFISDLKRRDLTYSVDRADHACHFISNLVHVKGELAGQPLVLEPFQLFILCNLFGLLNRKTQRRKYREALILLPRKNGKSALAAGIALYMTFADGEPGAEGYSGATNLEQAMEVFRPAARMAELAPGLAEALDIEVAARSVYSLTSGSSLKPVIAKTKDGSSPHIAVCDELHQAIDSTQIDAFRTGMGARRQPLLLVISTAGVNLAGVCRQHQLYCEAVLQGSITDDRQFAIIYTIDPKDDWRDFAVWRKANPALDVSISEEYLRDQHAKALQSPSNQAIARTKFLNQWVSSSNGWLNQKDWADAARPDLVIPPSAPAWLGVDLSTKTDITAVSMVAILPDGGRAVIPSLFLPEGALDRSKNAKAYAEWTNSGALTGTEGEASDHEAVEAHIRALCSIYNVQGILFDPWQSASMSQRLAADGMAVMEFKQSAANFGPAMIDFEADLMNGQLVHTDNPALNWMAQNICANIRGAMMTPCKPAGQDHLKIDGMVAALMAYAASTVAPPPPRPDFSIFALD